MIFFSLLLGSCSEFVTCPDRYVALKPPSLSFDEAASIPLAAMTALQALRRYEGDLTGKTVLVPAGCTLYNPRNFCSQYYILIVQK
jgi:NADPH:quinone reductase-like Zn-dependent oxidoreductase